MVDIFGIASPVIGEPNSSGEPETAVDDQHLSVGAVVCLLERPWADWIEPSDLDAGTRQRIDGRTRELRTEGIEHNADGHTASRRCHQFSRELVADEALLVDEALENDSTLGAPNGVEHGGKDLITVSEHQMLVARFDCGADQ